MRAALRLRICSLGELSDRCGRTFARLGMARVPKEVGIAPYAARTEVWSPLKDALARDAKPRSRSTRISSSLST
jgi:hypothetical protein